MWGFVDCTRYHLRAGEPKVILHDASLVVQTGERIALLVRRGEGKSTIMRMLAGLELPDSGIVLRDEGGWPLGYSGGFRIEMTGDGNIRNLAGLADADADELSAFCYEFSELGEFYHEPLNVYTGTMKAQLAFAASFGIPARTYLADDKLAVGDDDFRSKCMDMLCSRLTDRGLIFVTSNAKAAKDICERFYVVSDGKFLECSDYEEAVALFASAEQAPLEELEDDVPMFDLA